MRHERQAGAARARTLIAEEAAVHHRRRSEAHLAQLRRVVERAAIGKWTHLPKEPVEATWQSLHIEHPRERLLLVRLEVEGEAGGLRRCAVAGVLDTLEHALERKRLGARSAVATEGGRVARQAVHEARRGIGWWAQVREQQDRKSTR